MICFTPLYSNENINIYTTYWETIQWARSAQKSSRSSWDHTWPSCTNGSLQRKAPLPVSDWSSYEGKQATAWGEPRVNRVTWGRHWQRKSSCPEHQYGQLGFHPWKRSSVPTFAHTTTAMPLRWLTWKCQNLCERASGFGFVRLGGFFSSKCNNPQK